jgi:hypothetical protein
MTTEKSRDAPANDEHPITHVRDAHDAQDHEALAGNPSDREAATDIANDESFPASDPPSHNPIGKGDPAPSSGYDERAERKMAAMKVGSPMHHDETSLTDIEASGGKKLGIMRYVLGISLVAIILIFGILLLLYR